MIKIIKGYFIFMMVMVGMSFSSQTETAHKYYASVLGAVEQQAPLKQDEVKNPLTTELIDWVLKLFKE